MVPVAAARVDVGVAEAPRDVRDAASEVASLASEPVAEAPVVVALAAVAEAAAEFELAHPVSDSSCWSREHNDSKRTCFAARLAIHQHSRQ